MRLSRLFPLLALVAFPCPITAADTPAAPTLEQAEFFEKKIRPLLVETCFKCHSEKSVKIKGGLRLDSRAALLKGGDSGPALVPGQPDKSKLIEAVSYKNSDLQMPPRGKLADSALADLAAWVKMGAPWPGSDSATVAANADFDLAKRRREHWAWQPLRPVPPPAVKDANWPRAPSDRFLLARLEEKGLHPAAEADRRTLLRRVTFDLIGLPPTPEEIASFLAADRPDALERVVDRLLSSPHFGERWGRHWLDLVRYGETRGHEFDPVLPNAYQYRDYIIRALNADVPYNQLVLEHVAGDLLQSPRLHPTEKFNESILGTGFWLLGEEVHSPVDVRLDQADRFDNRIDVLSKTFLGLTVSCARCHDHKFDAISTRDYYSLFAILESCSYRLARFDGWEQNRKVAAELQRLTQRRQDEARTLIARRLAATAERLPDYLLAVREALLARPELLKLQPVRGSKTGLRPDAFTPADREILDRSASQRKLQPALLAAWTAETISAQRDPEHFLHAWARAAVERDGKALAGALEPVIQALKQRQAEAEQARKRLDVVVDYAQTRPTEWMPDDVAFGPRPRRAGDPEVSGTQVRLAERSAAEYDRFWDVLSSPGTQNEPGSLGSRGFRAGRVLRTPSFVIGPGTVWSLVRGNGTAYAAVSNHVMIQGPLHAQLVLSIQGGTGYRWVAHNLNPYRGLRAHVEFTAAPGNDFAVAMVVQAAAAPNLPEPPSGPLLKVLTEQASSAEALARGYASLLSASASLPRQGGEIRLLNSLLERPDLLGEGETGKELEALGQSWQKERQTLAGQVQRESRLALALQDGDGVEGHVFIRGMHRSPGEPVQRRFLEALGGKEPLRAAGSGRLELARQMLDPARNPLIARVIVNRLWHHLFGVGIVSSVDNFGTLGEQPNHPELLDFLADRFVREGWSIKKTIRELVLSSAYRMASKADQAAEQSDPQDRLLHRMRARRLQGEAIRDSLLAISGRLDRKMAGPSVPIYLTPFLEGRGRPGSGPLDGNGRRSVYLAVTRNFLSPLMLTFDTPIPFSTVGRRTVSNVPAQALILLNDPFVHQQTELWGKKSAARAGTPGERVERMYLEAFGRPCSSAEREACLAFLEQQAKLHQAGADTPAPWVDLAHALVNVKEFIYLH